MTVVGLTPILNVSDIPQSFAWFEKLGWTRDLAWGDPITFGSVISGHARIFLCKDGQGGTVWMTWWVGSAAEVDETHELAQKLGMTITRAPVNEPWGIREFHLGHPDGHTFRVSAGIEES